jgi:transcriptional regulator with XRE-family HTH domain
VQRAAHAPYPEGMTEGRANSQAGLAGRCRICRCKLSRYNSSGDICGPCERAAPADAVPPAAGIPRHVWSHREVRDTLAALDFGRLSRLLRQLASLRQEDLATMAGVSQGYLSQLESGSRRLANIDKAIAFLNALEVPPELVRLPLSGSAEQSTHEQSNHDRTSHPRHLRSLAAQAAEESLEFADFVTPSNIDDDALEYLSFEMSRIATDYVHTPLLPLVGDLISLRDRIFTLLKGRQRPQQTRELFLLAGTACLLLSHASQNLGDSRSAMAQVRTAWTCAEQADHTGLRAWTRGTAALIAEWSPHNRMALKLAEHGAALAPAGESRIRVAAIEARAAARIGDRQRALAAVERIKQARAETPQHDEVQQFGGLLTFPTAKQEYYLGSTYAMLGEYAEAEKHALTAVGQYASGPPERRSYGDEALASIDIVMARLAQGDVDAAAQRLQRILTLPSEFRIQQLGSAMNRVAGLLQQPALADNREARALCDLARGYQVIEGGHPIPSLR